MNCNINSTSQAVCPSVNCNSKLAMKLPFSNEADKALDSKAEADVLLDLILREDGIAALPSALSASPPFFNGSPPSRPMNPLIHDVCFANYGKKFTCSPISASATASPLQSSSCKARLIGQKTQAPARVEGFDCPNFSSG